MNLISDKYHKKKLKELGINIKTKYIVGNKILERNTDNSINDDIIKGIRCKKEYYLQDKLIHEEKLFDSRIEYTYISKEYEYKEYICPNCGLKSFIKDFSEGCPYCRTHYNIDYIDKDLGSKYQYDLVLKNNLYKIITAIVDLIISLLLSYVFIKLTSRTFNNYDIYKIFIYGFILSVILYYFFYLMDAYVILYPIKKYKDKQNKKQIEFWKKIKIDKKIFYNNLNYEIRKNYYTNSNIIDYDILDYINFNYYEKDGKMFIETTVEIRIIQFINNKIKSKIIKQKYLLKKQERKMIVLENGINLIKCKNCGASIDATKGICEYCHTEIGYLQDWVMEKYM